MLLASAAAVPVLVGAAGCRSSDMFTGPDPLAGPPSPPPDVITLRAVIAAEQTMIGLYRAAIGGGRARGLEPLLAEHQQHLARLRARLIVPAGAPASPSPSASQAPRRVTIARLRAAERGSAAGLVQRLGAVEPALAQLFASIAASDATHAAALGG